MRRRLLLPCLLWTVVGCSTLLGLDEFEDAKGTATGGTGGQAGASGSGASGGLGGGGTGGVGASGGSGGVAGGDGAAATGGTGGTLFGCKVESTNVIVQGIPQQQTTDNQSVLTISDGGSAVYAVVQLDPVSPTEPMLVLVEIADNGTVGASVTFTENDLGTRVKVSDGIATGAHLYLFGRVESVNKAAVLDFAVGGPAIQLPTIKPLDQPCGAEPMKKAIFSLTGAPTDPHYAVTCSTVADENSRLFACQAGVCSLVADFDAGADPASLNVASYVNDAGWDLLQTEAGFTWWRDSTNSSAPWVGGRPDMTPTGIDASHFMFGLGLVPRPTGDGAVVFAGAFDQTTLKHQVFSGALSPTGGSAGATGQYSDLAIAKTPALSMQFELPVGSLILSRAHADASRIVVAGADFDHATVKVHEFLSDGSARVVGEVVEAAAEAGTTHFHRGSGAPLGPVKTYVAWMQGPTAGDPDAVMGRILNCTQPK